MHRSLLMYPFKVRQLFGKTPHKIFIENVIQILETKSIGREYEFGNLVVQMPGHTVLLQIQTNGLHWLCTICKADPFEPIFTHISNAHSISRPWFRKTESKLI